MTLSHRWGTAQFTKLLKSNLDSFCDGISVADLPKIFQEAVFASRQLGVHYLWIDSLCIMQDKHDLTDWKHEASLMSKVYSHSHCNLSASDTDENANTLFKHRDVRSLQPINIQLCTTGFDKNVDSVICQLIHKKLLEENVSRCPIQKRGWVYQERVLAPRIIHFGHDQLFWECREQRFCEQHPHGLPLTVRDYSGLNFKQVMDFERISLELASRDLHPDSPNRNDACFRIWADVVRNYSQTTLTNPTDKLIAISGIAKSFADVTGQTYIAGLWREGLEYSLLWYQPDQEIYDVDDNLFPQPMTWRAPSWSWASVDGPVDFWRSIRDHKLISVHDVVLTYATEDKMGILTGGQLDLRGALKLMRISYKYNSDTSNNGRGFQENGKWEISDSRMPHKDRRVTFLLLDARYLDPSAFSVDKTEVDLFYMPATLSNYPDFHWVHLLLLRVIDPHKSLFERVGKATRFVLEHESLDEFLKNDTSEWKKECLPNLEYLEDGTHIIHIV
jgi:hypothetical protein